MDYQLTRSKRSKYIRLRVTPGGILHVSAPKYALKRQIDEFVRQQKPWIDEQLRTYSSQVPLIDKDEMRLMYLGKWCVVEHGNEDQRVIDNDSQMIVSPVTGLNEDVWPTLMSWLKKRARSIIGELVSNHSTSMNVRYRKIRYGQQRTRWGSCSSSGTLSFNWRLVHFPLSVIEYVVIHELAHIKHLDHSDAFWRLVAIHCPDYAEAKIFLRKQHIALV